MTQAEFLKWLESVLGETPLDEMVAPEIMAHIDRIHLNTEDAAFRLAKEDAREPFTVTLRALSKTMFIVGYDAGREQARIDGMFGSGSGLDESDDGRPGEDNAGPSGALPI